MKQLLEDLDYLMMELTINGNTFYDEETKRFDSLHTFLTKLSEVNLERSENYVVKEIQELNDYKVEGLISTLGEKALEELIEIQNLLNILNEVK